MGATIKAIGLIGAIWLAGCSQKEEALPAQSTTQAAKSQTAGMAAEKKPIDTTTKAVEMTKGEQPLELQFELKERPMVGNPVNLQLNVLGLVAGTDMHFQLSGDEHMAVSNGDFSVAQLAVGQTYMQTLSLQADTAGLAMVDVTLQGTFDGGKRELHYAIPVAVMPVEAMQAAAQSQ